MSRNLDSENLQLIADDIRQRRETESAAIRTAEVAATVAGTVSMIKKILAYHKQKGPIWSKTHFRGSMYYDPAITDDYLQSSHQFGCWMCSLPKSVVFVMVPFLIMNILWWSLIPVFIIAFIAWGKECRYKNNGRLALRYLCLKYPDKVGPLTDFEAVEMGFKHKNNWALCAVIRYYATDIGYREFLTKRESKPDDNFGLDRTDAALASMPKELLPEFLAGEKFILANPEFTVRGDETFQAAERCLYDDYTRSPIYTNIVAKVKAECEAERLAKLQRN